MEPNKCKQCEAKVNVSNRMCGTIGNTNNSRWNCGDCKQQCEAQKEIQMCGTIVSISDSAWNYSKYEKQCVEL